MELDTTPNTANEDVEITDDIEIKEENKNVENSLPDVCEI